jgi:hypothetical protein
LIKMHKYIGKLLHADDCTAYIAIRAKGNRCKSFFQYL